MTERAHKVLVADDDASVRESLRKLLQDDGYQVLAVANGVEAIEIVRVERNQIDLLLVDLNMPLKNGWATLDQLLESNPSLPVLIVTGQPNQYEMAEAARVIALVEKPIDVPALLKLMQELMAVPVQSRLPRAPHRDIPFHHLRAAGYSSHYLWTERPGESHSHWGINE